MILYIETSAVLSWLFGESAGTEVVKAVNASESVLTSTLTALETERGIMRAVLTSLVSETQAGRLRKLFRENLRGWECMEITREVRERAAASFPVEPVRSLDAIHLATALQFVELYDDVRVLSCDKRILDNLAPLGFLPPLRSRRRK